MEKTCLHCTKTFSGMPHYIKARRFCSRACWFAWHTGANNPQTHRVTVACDHCGKRFSRTPHEVGEKNYCSSPCARAEHPAKISGEKSGLWRGGQSLGRGSSWPTIRRGVIRRQGGLCGNCGMTEDAHRERYGRSLDVHHRSPYRLSMSNESDNLVALCKKCHGSEEAAQRRAMTAEDLEAMRLNTEAMRESGLWKQDSERVYDTCPKCGGRKARKGRVCRQCLLLEKRAAQPPELTCPKCGHWKARVSRLCRACARAEKVKP